MMNERISSIMSTNLVTVSPDDKLSAVREILIKRRVHHIPVKEDDILVGLVTTYDLFVLDDKPADYSDRPVKDIMTTRLAYLEPHDKVGTAAEIFLEHLFQAVPIVNNRTEKKLVGIITMFDILQYQFRKEYPKHNL